MSINLAPEWKKNLKYFSTLGLTPAELEIQRFAAGTPALLELNEKVHRQYPQELNWLLQPAGWIFSIAPNFIFSATNQKALPTTSHKDMNF